MFFYIIFGIWFVVVDICLISKKRKDRLLNAINTQLAKLERKNPKNKSNSDMLVDAEIGGGEEEEEEEEAVLEKKAMKN
jgi:hypothetical protein